MASKRDRKWRYRAQDRRPSTDSMSKASRPDESWQASSRRNSDSKTTQPMAILRDADIGARSENRVEDKHNVRSIGNTDASLRSEIHASRDRTANRGDALARTPKNQQSRRHPARFAPGDRIQSARGHLVDVVPIAIDAPVEGRIDSTLVTNFTHQIINPLNGVVGTLDNLIDGTTSEDRRPQRLRAARAQLSGAIELVRNLAYLSQLSTEAGVQSLRERTRECIIPELVIEAALFFQEIADQKGLTIHLVDRETQYVVLGHPALLRQVFINLFDNAVKYSDEGTQILVRGRIQKGSNVLFLEFENTGLGFDSVERTMLFGIGFRGEQSRRHTQSGSGLGLYLCKEILTIHNATIEAEYQGIRRLARFRIRFGDHRVDPPRRDKK